MNRAKIKFSSVTYALKAKEIIENNGGKAKISKNTSPARTEGCGYYLIVIGNISRFINILKINHINFSDYELI